MIGLRESQTSGFTLEAEGAAGLDSCCSRTLMGKPWFDRYKQIIPKKTRDQIKGPLETDVNFTFGYRKFSNR